MELFLPSLIVLVLGAVVCFFVIPKMSPYALGVIAIVMLGLGIWQHYKMFPYEYRVSGVTVMAQEYSGFLMIAVVILGGVSMIAQFYGVNPPPVTDILPASVVPDLGLTNNSKNSSKSIFNLGGNNSKSIFNLGGNNSALSNPIATVTNMFKNNSKNAGIASTSFKTV